MLCDTCDRRTHCAACSMGLPEENCKYYLSKTETTSMAYEMEDKTVNIMGTEWKLLFRTVEEDSRLEGRLGQSDTSCREISILKEWGDNPCKDFVALQKRVIRHEITHVFLFECGLDSLAHSTDAWADDEEIIDWIALNGPKLYAVWKELGVAE